MRARTRARARAQAVRKVSVWPGHATFSRSRARTRTHTRVPVRRGRHCVTVTTLSFYVTSRARSTRATETAGAYVRGQTAVFMRVRARSEDVALPLASSGAEGGGNVADPARENRKQPRAVSRRPSSLEPR